MYGRLVWIAKALLGSFCLNPGNKSPTMAGKYTTNNQPRQGGRRRAAMGKTNWSRVFLGGLLAGIVLNILSFATLAMYMGKLFGSALEALGHPIQQAVESQILLAVYYFVLGILAVWLYSAIRPRYGAGLKRL
jgi:hypothetical protein